MISRRERAAFESFVTASSDRLIRTAFLLCGDRGDAEDLVQTALMRTARRWRQARTNPEAYARRVVVNLAHDRRRNHSRRPVEVPLEVDVPHEETGAALDREILLQATRLLPEGQRTALVLRYFDDLSIEATALAMGCSTGTVKSQTARALATLRGALTANLERANVE